jgi:tetratricopeptide (TPR) repeat protein
LTRSAAALLALALAGCAAAPLGPPGTPQRLELAGVPFYPQDRYQCGPAALATLLGASGATIAPAELVPEIYLPARHGSLQLELLAATRRHGRVAYPLPPDRRALAAELAAGRPVLVLQNFGSASLPAWHYAVVIGYEPGHLLLRSGLTERLELSESRFDGTWSRAGRWAFVALRPGELPASDEALRYAEAASAFEAVASDADAVAAFGAATERWPAEPAGWLGLGNARERRGDHLGAEAAYRAALAAVPGYAAARNNLAELLARRGCLAAARREILRADRDAAGTALATAVAATRSDIEAREAAAEPAGCPES